MFAIFLFVTYYLQDDAALHADPDRPLVPADGRDARARRPARNQLPGSAPRPEDPGADRHADRAQSGWSGSRSSTLTSTYVRRHHAAADGPRIRDGHDHARLDADARRSASTAQYAGVASALVNTSQQVGGSIGTALLNTLAASAVTAYIADHPPPTPGGASRMPPIHSYADSRTGWRRGALTASAP